MMELIAATYFNIAFVGYSVVQRLKRRIKIIIYRILIKVLNNIDIQMIKIL